MYTTTEVPAGTEPVSFQQFQENISKQMNLPIGSFEIRYKDDEGDVIAISSDMELQEAIRQASTRIPAVIEVIVETRQTPVEKTAEKMEEKVAAAKVQEHTEQISHPDQGISEIILHKAVCSNCQFPIVGVRYKCAICPHFDLCEICEMMDNSHPVDHPLIKAKRPLSPEFSHIFNMTYGLHNGVKSVEKGYHRAADGLHYGIQTLGTNVQQYGSYIGANVQQYGSQVGNQIKQTWTEHQPQIDAARQRAYEKWTEVKEQVKVISENMKIKAKEFHETLKKESSEWFKEGEDTTTYPGNAAQTPSEPPVPAPTPVSAPVPIPTPAPMPASVLAASSTPPKIEPIHISQSPPVRAPAPLATHPSAPAKPAIPSQYQQQLEVLASMGFTDVPRNVTLLLRYQGDVSACVQALLDNTTA